MIRFIIVWFLECLWFLSDLLLKPRKLSYEKGYRREVAFHRFSEEIYRSRDKQNFRIDSDYGYDLYCELIEAKQNEEKKIAILCHGFGYASYGSIKYLELFLQLGFTVLMFDHRNHGHSGKANTSMGFYEKHDLNRVIDWCYEHYGRNCKVVTHGESMGAATVLLQLGIDDRVKCVIADCGYSDLKSLLCHQLKQYYHLPRFLIPLVSAVTYLRAGFWFRQVSPIEVVRQTDTPILFIHGKRDNLVPAVMSREMYRVKRNKKAILLIAKAKHTESFIKQQQEYATRIAGFLERYIE